MYLKAHKKYREKNGEQTLTTMHSEFHIQMHRWLNELGRKKITINVPTSNRIISFWNRTAKGTSMQFKLFCLSSFVCIISFRVILAENQFANPLNIEPFHRNCNVPKQQKKIWYLFHAVYVSLALNIEGVDVLIRNLIMWRRATDANPSRENRFKRFSGSILFN